MIKIDKIKSFGFTITWDIIRVGWEGPGNFLRQLSVDQINYFADLIINSVANSELDKVAELSITSDEQVISEILFRLSPEVSNHAQRVWRVILLESTLSNLPNNSINGLTALTDFWSQFDYPPDSPHTLQGVGNDIDPEKYYTQEIFTEILNKHKVWLKSEIKDLIANPKKDTLF